jgi:hypothetical protein
MKVPTETYLSGFEPDYFISTLKMKFLATTYLKKKYEIWNILLRMNYLLVLISLVAYTHKSQQKIKRVTYDWEKHVWVI